MKEGCLLRSANGFALLETCEDWEVREMRNPADKIVWDGELLFSSTSKLEAEWYYLSKLLKKF